MSDSKDKEMGPVTPEEKKVNQEYPTDEKRHEPMDKKPEGYPTEDVPPRDNPIDTPADRAPSSEEGKNPPVDEDDNAPTSLFAVENMRIAVVQACGATLNGYSIGYVGVYSTLYGFSTNCALYKGGPRGCNTAANADCLWYPTATGGYCGWFDHTCRVVHPNAASGGVSNEVARDSCLGDSKCKWSYSDDECQNPYGYSSSDNGIFAGSMILGCMFGSFFAGPLVTAIGSKLAFLLIGVVGIICSIMYHVSAAENEFWVLIVGRFVIGLALGIVGVACPVYVDQNAHPKYKRMIGVLFQVFTTFGIFLAATIGLAVGQSVYFSRDKDQMLMARMQALCVFSTVFSIVMIVLGVCVTETKAKFASDDEEGGKEGGLKANEYSIAQMLPRLAVGAVMAGTLQLTGINAVMNYAPTIMGSLGLAPLVGNFVVMVWNFVTTIASIPLASVFTMRQLFLFGSIFTSMMCLFMCGVPVYPGVTKSETAKNGVAITGILLFILGFECCVGPCYYVLTQDLFPPSFRPTGASITQVIQFIFNVIINVCYPIATEKISGGPSGDQDKGQAVAFIFFGCLGTICFIFQIFFLRPYEDGTNDNAGKDIDVKKDKKNKDKYEDGGNVEDA